MTSPFRLGKVGLPNWSHTGVILTSLIRSDLVEIGQVMPAYLTGQNMTSPPLVGLGQVRSC